MDTVINHHKKAHSQPNAKELTFTMYDKLKENSRRLKLAALKNRIREGQKPAHQAPFREQVRNEQKVPKI